MSVERKLRYTLSAAAWVGSFLCALGLLSSAMSVAATGAQHSHAAEAPR
jgi:hypothetical protein